MPVTGHDHALNAGETHPCVCVVTRRAGLSHQCGPSDREQEWVEGGRQPEHRRRFDSEFVCRG